MSKPKSFWFVEHFLVGAWWPRMACRYQDEANFESRLLAQANPAIRYRVAKYVRVEPKKKKRHK